MGGGGGGGGQKTTPPCFSKAVHDRNMKKLSLVQLQMAVSDKVKEYVCVSKIFLLLETPNTPEKKRGVIHNRGRGGDGQGEPNLYNRYLILQTPNVYRFILHHGYHGNSPGNQRLYVGGGGGVRVSCGGLARAQMD